MMVIGKLSLSIGATQCGRRHLQRAKVNPYLFC
jgi:hypothetical protein